MFHAEIHIKGRLDQNWSGWFDNMQVQARGGETVLCGDLLDKSSVYGVISRLGSLGVTLISVTCQEINHHAGSV